MNKQIQIFFFALVILLIGFFLYFWLDPSSGSISDETVPGSPFPISGDSVVDTQAANIVVRTNNGSVEVRNFLRDSRTRPDPVNSGHYQLGTFIDPAIDAPSQESYMIEYITATDYFNVVLLKEPIGETRQTVERYLMEQLGVTEEQMCSLKYMVSVPYRVNEYYAGVSLGFSFCPGSVPLE